MNLLFLSIFTIISICGCIGWCVRLTGSDTPKRHKHISYEKERGVFRVDDIVRIRQSYIAT